MKPNRIALKIGSGRYDEIVAGAELFPGMLVLENSSNQAVAHSVAGGGGHPIIVQEEALAGRTILQAITSGDPAPVRRAGNGDQLLCLLQSGQNVAHGTHLMSAGDGTLMAVLGPTLANIVAPSTTITNTNVETTFSNGTLTIPANSLKVGDVIRIHARAFCIAQNSTDTHRIRLYINSTTLADSTALALDPNDWVMIDMELTIRTIGATGTFVADGELTTVVAGTPTTVDIIVASTTLDTTAAAVITIKSLASATSTGNQIRLDEFNVQLERAGGINALFTADEAIDNSSGSAIAEFVGKGIAGAQHIRALAI